MVKLSNTVKIKQDRILAFLIGFALISLGLLLISAYMDNDSTGGTIDKPDDSTSTCRLVNYKEVCSDAYKGLSEKDALSKADKNNLAARVIMRDGEPLPATMDYNPGRLNFEVKKGLVVSSRFD